MKNSFFYQIVKYTYAQQGIEAMRIQEKHRILEVGVGGQSTLEKFLPNDIITFIDVESLDEVLDDNTLFSNSEADIMYEDGYFDFIVVLDALEYIETDKRLNFIKIINSMAKIGVILSAFHYSENELFENELLKFFYEVCGMAYPHWADGHKDCTFLSKEDIATLIKNAGVDSRHVLSYCGLNRELLIKMSIMEVVASKIHERSDCSNVMDSDYIHTFLCQNIGLQEEDSLKTYAIWTKDDSVERAKKHFCKDCDTAQKAIDIFEKKYMKLIELGLNLYHFNDMKKAAKRNIKLNVVLVTYNQAKFIRKTLETILMQQTLFDYNIIVADDCSTDDTVSIIKQIEKQTAVPFIYLSNNHNLGIMQNYKRAFESCDAEYVAIMEGDDLWTDKLRLQKHVDFLEEHHECAMTFNRYVVKNFEEGTIATQPQFANIEDTKNYKYIDGHDLAYTNYIGNFSTCVYRNSVLKSLPEQMYSMKGYDWLTNIMVSKMGYIGCLIQPMSIYRVHSSGTWSKQSDKEKILAIIEAIDIYDEYTNREFSKEFSSHKLRLQTQLRLGRINKIKLLIKYMIKGCYKLSSYLPTIFTCIIKLIMPPIINDIVSETCER